MFCIKNYIIYILFFNILGQNNGLIELPDIEFNEIVTTEAAIRHTVNTIFSSLKLKGGKRKAKYKEFSSMHNLFVSITVQDQFHLKEIAKHAKADNSDNSTQSFIALINEILTEDNKSYETTDDVYVTTHIQAFIKRLDKLKHKYLLSRNASKYDINAEIIKHLDANKVNFVNITENNKESNGTNDNNVLTDDEFWQPSGRRIYMGRTVPIKRYPFVASVQFFKKFQCAGSIIKSDLVITAASCLQLAWNNRFFRENPSFLSVQVGCSFYQNCAENIPVIEVYFHPEYDPKILKNNLAIMRLIRILKLGKKVKLVKKIDFDRNAWALPSNVGRITILGWGARSNANIMRSPWYDRLAVAEIDFYPLRECQEVYTKEYVTYKNFCAGFFSKGGGACNRDVGAPGVQSAKLMGVVSFGTPACGAPDAPTVFTKLGYYADWIEEIMEQNVPVHNAPTTQKTTKDYSSRMKMLTERTTLYKIYPVTGSPKQNEEELDAETLRTIAESDVFKQFLETMFSSNEVTNYMKERLEDEPQGEESEPENERDDDVKIFTRPPPQAATGQANEVQIKPSTEAAIKSLYGASGFNIEPNVQDTEESTENEGRVTKIENFDRDFTEREKHTTAPYHYYPVGKQTAMMDDAIIQAQRHDIDNGQDVKDVQIKDAIEKLIHDLDFEVVKDKPREAKRPENEKKQSVYAYVVESTESSGDSESSDGGGADSVVLDSSTDGQDDGSSSEDSKLLNIPPLSLEESRKKIVPKDVNGLSIPANEYKDLTFRQNTSGVLSFLTNDELINLLSEAVAESNFLKN